MPVLEIEETDQQARLMGVSMERMTRDQPPTELLAIGVSFDAAAIERRRGRRDEGLCLF